MVKGTLTLKSETRGPLFDRFTVEPKPLGASEIALASEADGLTLILRIEGASSPPELVQHAEDIAEHFRIMLSVALESEISEFRMKDHSFELEQTEPAKEGVVTGIGYVTLPAMTMRGYGTFTPPRWKGEKVDRLKAYLESKKPGDNLFYEEMFVSAMQTDDPVANFMIVYLIGLSLCGDNQQAFDTEIRRIEPSVLMSTGHKGKPESIYTKLRNEVGHVRVGATIENTRNGMEQNRRGLVTIVKKLMVEKGI